MQLGLGLTLDNQIVISGRGGAGSSDPVQLGLWYLGTRFLRGKMFLILRNVATSAAILTAGSLWDGTAGSGGSAAAESAAVRGSGFAQKAIGNFDEYPYVWVETNSHEITVGAAIGDRAWIENVTFYLEGNSVTVVDQRINARTGSMGWSVIVRSNGTADGDAVLYAYIKPVNGYERRISIPLTLNTNASITRAVRYIDYTNGNDGNAGTSAGAGNAWKTFNKAMVSMTDAALGSGKGGICYYATGQTYLEDSATGTSNSNTRMIDFRPLGGSGTATISKTTRASWTLKALRVCFDATIDFGQISGPFGMTNSTNIWKGHVTDPNGVNGPPEYYVASGAAANISNSPFRINEGQFHGLVDCTLVAQVSAGLSFARNSTASISWDAVFNGTLSDTRFFNYAVTQTVEGKVRVCTETSLIVNAATYDGGTGLTTVTFQGSPTTFSVTGEQNAYVDILTGALAASAVHLSTGSLTLAASITSPPSINIIGDYSALASGDTLRTYVHAHSDTWQLTQRSQTSANLENMYCQRYKAVGHSTQPILSQSGSGAGSGTITTDGAGNATFSVAHNLQLNDFVNLTNGSQHYQNRRVVALPDTTHATLSSDFSSSQAGATWSWGKTAKDVAFVNSILATDKDATVGFGALTQIQNGNQHWVFAQTTHWGTAFDFRAEFNGFGLDGFTMFDSLFGKLATSTNSLDVSNPPGVLTGVNIDNNAFTKGSAPSGTTNNTLQASVVLDASYKPTSGLTKAIVGNPLVPWDYSGKAIVAGALVGAQQA